MNRKILSFLFLAGLVSVSFFACKKKTDTPLPNDSGSAYYPLRVGKFIIYNVDSTIWNDFDCSKVVHSYQMRYDFVDTFLDNSGNKSYRVETSIRTADTLPWNPSNVFYATIAGNQIQTVESNLRFIKLVLPVTEGTSWNGNSMIQTNDQDLGYFSGWNYTYANVGKPYIRDTFNFDNTVTVNEADMATNDPETMPTAYADKTYSQEVYEYNVGLVYKELTHWTYNYNPGGSTNCRKGYSVIMRAISNN